MANNIPSFATDKEATQFWEQKAKEMEAAFEIAESSRKKIEDEFNDYRDIAESDKKELESEFDEFRTSSELLEKELEKDLEQLDQSYRDLRIKCNRLTFDFDASMDKNRQLTKEMQEVHQELSKYREGEAKILNYVRELEQKNDDLERSHRAVMASVDDIKTQLDGQIEKNALLETELDEKDSLQTLVQRLKDEQRDLQQELQRKLRQRFPDNERLQSPVDSNKLNSFADVESESKPVSPHKMSVSMGQLSPPPTRVTAMNLVGDLLRKVGSLESKLAASRLPRDSTDPLNKDSYRSRNQRIIRNSSNTLNGAVKL